MVAVCSRLALALAIVTVLLDAAASTAHAQDARLVAQCSDLTDSTPPPPSVPPPSTPPAPPPPAARPGYALTCELHVTDAVTFQGVKVLAKGRTEPIESRFTPYDPKERTLSVMFLMQVLEPHRRATAQQMMDAVIKIADARDGKRRYAAFAVANDLEPLAPFSASKADFDKGVRSLKLQTLPTQLYQATLDAIARLSKEPGDRKAIILVGDGNSDDTGYTHERVVAAAKASNITLHALGFVEVATDLPKFQILRRLAEDTGGFQREFKLARDGRHNLTPKFTSEVLENGGALKIVLNEPPGPLNLRINAELQGGKTEGADYAVTIPAPPPPPEREPTQKSIETVPQSMEERITAWVRENRIISYVIGIGFSLAAMGFLLFAFGRKPIPPEPAPSNTTGKPDRSVLYGWLEMLDGNGTRHELRLTNIRIGRHRDNDVCLQNDSISRRHALMHYNADTGKFVITDLGGNNGVVVNKMRKKTHELENDDLIELGEVRLRFRANPEILAKP